RGVGPGGGPGGGAAAAAAARPVVLAGREGLPRLLGGGEAQGPALLPRGRPRPREGRGGAGGGAAGRAPGRGGGPAPRRGPPSAGPVGGGGVGGRPVVAARRPRPLRDGAGPVPLHRRGEGAGPPLPPPSPCGRARREAGLQGTARPRARGRPGRAAVAAGAGWQRHVLLPPPPRPPMGRLGRPPAAGP